MTKSESDIKSATVKICSKCIYDERVNGITFDDEGVCNYCKQIENLKAEYGTGTTKGIYELERLVEQIKKAGKGKGTIVGANSFVNKSFPS